jgi:hypothetical protein
VPNRRMIIDAAFEGLPGVSRGRLAARSALYSRGGVLQTRWRQTWITVAGAGTQR